MSNSTPSVRRKRRAPNGNPRPYPDGKRWIAPGKVTYPDGSIQKFRVSGSTQLAAQERRAARAAELLAAHAEKSACSEPGYDVNRAVAEWLQTVAPITREYKTIEGYWTAYRKWIEPHFAGLRLRDVEYAHVAALKQKVLGQRSTSAWRQVRTVLNQVFNEAIRVKAMDANPLGQLTWEKPTKSSADHLSLAETRAVVATAREAGVGPRWLLALATGMRQGECLGLRWQNVDIDSDQPEIRVCEQLQRQAGRGLILKRPKTSSAVRRIPLDPNLVEVLREHRIAQHGLRARAGDLWQDLGFVFTTPLGNPLDPANDRKKWLALLDAAGVRRVKLHCARHTAASLMFASNTPIYTVSRALGHSSISVTADIYGHVDREAVGHAVAAVARVIA